MLNLSVLIPWRTDNGSRARVFDYVLPLWEATGADICIGTDTGEGPFNCAMAQNDAFSKAKYDNLVMFGADMLPDLSALRYAQTKLEQGAPWLALFHDVGYFTREGTERIMRGETPYHAEAFGEYVPFCTGIIGLSRATYYEAGGMDERFKGWGMEDAAFRHTLNALHPDPPIYQDTLLCLWHEEGDRGKASQANWDLIYEYEARPERAQMQGYLEQRGRFV